MIIGKVIKVKVNYGWIISEPDIMYPVTARFEKKFPQHSCMQDTGKETKGIGYHWLSIMEKPLKVEVMSMLFFPQTSTATFGKRSPRSLHIQSSPNKTVMPTSYSLYRTISILMYCLKLHKRCFPADYCNGQMLRVWL